VLLSTCCRQIYDLTDIVDVLYALAVDTDVDGLFTLKSGVFRILVDVGKVMDTLNFFSEINDIVWSRRQWRRSVVKSEGVRVTQVKPSN